MSRKNSNNKNAQFTVLTDIRDILYLLRPQTLNRHYSHKLHTNATGNKLLHPSNPDGKTWNKLGGNGEHGEHGKDGKHQPDDLKHYIHESRHSIICESKHCNCQLNDSKYSLLRHLWRRLKIIIFAL